MEHVALYRQFRPENFDEVVEQKAAVTALRQSVKTGRLGHAYLFCGQRGTGKTSIARIFARAINCENPVNGNPCNKCAMCKGISDGSLLDVIEIDAASNRSIDNIKKICDEVNYSPSKAKYKVYIIDEVHMITNEAFNALLKTLEEPPAHAIFLFATTEPHSIPPTILSRCQRFDFRRISTESIIGRLRYICTKENIKASDEALKLIASISDGAMRDAISVLDQAASAAGPNGVTDESIEEMTGTVNISFLSEMAEILIDGRFDELLSKCRELSDSGRDVIQFSLDLAGYFRNLLIIRVMPDPTSLIPASAAALKKMYEVANKTNTNTLVGFISSLSKMISDLKWSPSVRTSFEINLLRLCGRKIKMDEVPLVIPDFVEKQAAAAASISARAAETAVIQAPISVPAPAEAPAPVEVPAAAEAQASIPVPVPAPAPQPEIQSETSQETLQETETASSASDETQEDTTAAPEAPAEAAEPETPAAPEAPASPAEEIPVFAPPAEEYAPSDTEDSEPDEDVPMENQMDIFSFGGSEPEHEAEPEAEPETVPVPAPAPVEPVSAAPSVPSVTAEPVKPSAPAGTRTGSIFANLSSSFMDDLDTSEPSDLYKPTGKIGETRQTAVSAAFDISGLVSRKETPAPLTTEEKWDIIRGNLSMLDLSDTILVVKDDSASIVFNNDSVMSALKVNPDNKKLSRSIKESFEGIEHVYMLRRVQAEKQGLIAPMPASEPENAGSPLDFGGDSFIQMAQQMGINTEIHFGDN